MYNKNYIVQDDASCQWINQYGGSSVYDDKHPYLLRQVQSEEGGAGFVGLTIWYNSWYDFWMPSWKLLYNGLAKVSFDRPCKLK